MSFLKLTDGCGHELRIVDTHMWLVQFRLMRRPDSEEAQTTAKTIQDVFGHFASKLNYKYMTDATTMRSVNMSLTKARRGFFAKVRGGELVPGRPRVTRAQVVRAAMRFGLHHCPADTPLFTYMQTRRLVCPGGELGEVLYFPNYRFLQENTGKKVMWALHTPLDYTKIAWFDDEDSFDADRWWAFEITSLTFNPRNFEWSHNLGIDRTA
jgi:hypothetical protein